MGFIIKNEHAVYEFLQKANFYRLMPYISCYSKENKSEKIHEFEKITDIYNFDNNLRSVIFKAIQIIELYLRTQLSYYHANKYGDYGYLNKKNFGPQHDPAKFRARIKNAAEVNKNNPLIKLYRSSGEYPLGVIIEFFSMGTLSTFYADMITENRKKIAGELYRATSNQMVSWLCCLTDLRNKCAHYSRLYCWNFSALPVIPKEAGFNADRRLFTQLAVLMFLYPDREQWNNGILIEIENIMEKYSESVMPSGIGFPKDWKNLLYKNF